MSIDLPNEDPRLIILLFQYLYFANYADGEYFDGLPSASAIMRADGVQDELLKDQGGIVQIVSY